MEIVKNSIMAFLVVLTILGAIWSMYVYAAYFGIIHCECSQITIERRE